jgi:hypothetical protein
MIIDIMSIDRRDFQKGQKRTTRKQMSRFEEYNQMQMKTIENRYGKLQMRKSVINHLAHTRPELSLVWLVSLFVYFAAKKFALVKCTMV